MPITYHEYWKPKNYMIFKQNQHIIDIGFNKIVQI